MIWAGTSHRGLSCPGAHNGKTDRRRRSGRRGRVPAALLAVSLLGLGLVGCGGGDEVIQNAAAAPTTTSTTTTTVPPTTTTTIDFDRPVVQGTAALLAGALPTDVAELVADIRGQTADVDAQVRRLAPFPDLTEPAVAQIMDIAVALAPAAEGGYPSTSRIRFRCPYRPADLAKLLSDDLRALGWFKSDETVQTAPVSDGDADGEAAGPSRYDMTFRLPGRAGDDLELRVTIEGGPLTVTVVDVEYSILAARAEAAPDDGDTYFERLSDWDGDLPIPRAADLIEVAIETAPRAGALTLRYVIAADDEAEAVAAVLGSIRRGGYRLVTTSEEAPTAGPLELAMEEEPDRPEQPTVVLEFQNGPEPGIVEFEAVVAFDMPLLD